METAFIPNLQADRRHAPRALIGARAVVTPEGKPATEHMVHDLSTGGVRLCGLPRAQIGDEITIRLRLAGGSASVCGRLLRAGSTAGKRDFAVEFFDVSAQAEDAIHDAVVAALSHPERRSVLLLRDEQAEWWPGRGWLDPVLPICVSATTPLEAVQCLETHRLEIGIADSVDQVTRASEWLEMYPEVHWRTVDGRGCLRLF